MAESISAEDFSEGVILECTEKKYIGFILGVDEMYLYFKYTHESKEVYPTPNVSTIEGVMAILAESPLWRLKLRVAKMFKVNPVRFSKEKVLRMLAEELVEREIENIVEKTGLIETFEAQPHPIKAAFSHDEVLSFKSLSDLKSSAILSGLDFPSE